MKILGVVSGCERVCPEDFSNDKYIGVALMQSPQNDTACLLRSRDGANRWCVVYGRHELYFKSKEDAVDYCKNHGFKNYRTN
ncbi:MAG: ETC complex I subunit [Clostridia bacterium]|nr:ETC complex I subunit [Clostridia bacterium]